VKTRITITLPPRLADRLDRELRRRPGLTRSGLVEEILARHYMDLKWAAHEAATVEYYTSRSAEEREEDEAIARAGSDALGRALERPDRTAPRPRRRRR
jgi:metal-responsive CopG/Arc/MetJ family transcriptional regulator